LVLIFYVSLWLCNFSKDLIMKNFSIIVAMDQNQGIGKDGQLPWHLPRDMKFFKEMTLKARPGRRNAVIMGRKTWDSIPESFRPLGGRLNIILTRNPQISFPEDCRKALDLDEALACAAESDDVDQIFVIGGATVYEAAIDRPECGHLYVTCIQEICDCDTFFPSFSGAFCQVSQGPLYCENNHHFVFLEYKRQDSRGL